MGEVLICKHRTAEKRLPADGLPLSEANCLVSGFTLIEVMIAMAMLLVGLLAFISIQITAIRTNDANRRFLIAQDTVSGEIESVKTLGYTGLATSASLLNSSMVYGYNSTLSGLNAIYQFTGINTSCNPPYSYCVYKGITVTRSASNGSLINYYYTIKLSYNTNYLSYPILGNGNMLVYWMAATTLKSFSINFFVE